jgi:hypothetical protein
LHFLERSVLPQEEQIFMEPNFQIININLSKQVVIKKPIVCDISPFPVQVINVSGLSEEQLLESVRGLSAWDMSNALSQQELSGEK